MRCTLVGSRYFGATVFDALRKDACEIVRVVAPAADDRLALAAQAAGVPVHVLDNPKNVPGDAIPDGTDLIVAAHTHARVSDEALARSRLGGIGYHPSLLPRHRGIAAVEWTILEGDSDRGRLGLSSGRWLGRGRHCRARLVLRRPRRIGARIVGAGAGADGARAAHACRARMRTSTARCPRCPQDERFATKAPMIRRTVSLTEERQPMITSLVVTVIGPDRPGIVSKLSAKAQRFGANWAGSRMASLAGQFAGIVHFEVPPENAEALAAALRDLESSDLRVVIVRGEGATVPAGRRAVKLELVGHDRPGIVRDLSGSLAERGVSIEELHTEIVSGAMSAEHLFKVKALLLVPKSVSNDELRRGLEALANEMMVDIALGEHAAGT